MTKIILSTTDKTPRGQVAIVCKALQHKDGYTAAELLAETGGYTPWNSWSLQRVADRFGFKFETVPGGEYEDGLTRYFFTPKAGKIAKPVVTTAKKPARKTSTTTKAAAFVMKRPTKKQAKTTRKAA